MTQDSQEDPLSRVLGLKLVFFVKIKGHYPGTLLMEEGKEITLHSPAMPVIIRGKKGRGKVLENAVCTPKKSRR